MYIEEGAMAGRGASECKGPEAGGYWGVRGPARRLRVAGVEREAAAGGEEILGPAGCGEDSDLYSVWGGRHGWGGWF